MAEAAAQEPPAGDGERDGGHDGEGGGRVALVAVRRGERVFVDVAQYEALLPSLALAFLEDQLGGGAKRIEAQNAKDKLQR